MKTKETNMHEELVLAVLEEYFSTRHNLPGISTLSNTELVREDKSTMDIIDDLSPMIVLAMSEVNTYMFSHGYKMAQQPDGSLKWVIWRDFAVGNLNE